MPYRASFNPLPLQRWSRLLTTLPGRPKTHAIKCKIIAFLIDSTNATQGNAVVSWPGQIQVQSLSRVHIVFSRFLLFFFCYPAHLDRRTLLMRRFRNCGCFVFKCPIKGYANLAKYVCMPTNGNHSYEYMNKYLCNFLEKCYIILRTSTMHYTKLYAPKTPNPAHFIGKSISSFVENLKLAFCHFFLLLLSLFG